MALLKMGSLVTQISGKIGGQTFGVGPGGQYVKNTGSYINKLTTLRALSNSRLSSLANSWRGLSTAEKNSWAAAAPNFLYVNRLGEVRTYSGYNLYMKFNSNRKIYGEAPVDTAPVPVVFTDLVSVILDVRTILMSWTLTGAIVGFIYVLFASNPSSAGSNFNQKGLRFIQSSFSANTNLEFDFFDEYSIIFGAPKVGQRIFFRVFTYEKSSGIKSGFFLDENKIVV